MSVFRSCCATLCSGICLAHALAAHAVPMQVDYGSADGEGFFDPELGAGRRAALEFAVDQWSRMLGGEVPITIDASMVPLGGDGGTALLASAGAVTLHRNFGGPAQTWYAAALANELAQRDLNGADVPEISIVFNADVDGPETLGSIGWYYGFDAQPAADIDLITIALHEIGHGLGFLEGVNPINAYWLNDSDPTIFDRMLSRPGVGKFVEMRVAERFSGIVASGRLLWSAPFVFGVNARPVPVYAPDPYVPGSSIGHWDSSLSPDELMEPFYAGANHDPGLLLPALVDMGWSLAAPTFTPGPPTWTPTLTATPSVAPTAAPPSSGFRDEILVTNFDSAAVSVIDVPPFRVDATIPVGDGPIGVVVSPDGTTAYVASFHAATVSVISTLERRVIDTIPVQGSANQLALTPDGSLLYVSDTFTDTVGVIDTATNQVIHTVPAPPQPAGVTVAPDGRAFVTNFGSNTVSVIDPALGEVVAKIVVAEFERAKGPLVVSIVPGRDVAYLGTAYGDELFEIDTRQLAPIANAVIVSGPVEAIALTPDGSAAYFAANDVRTGNGVVRELDLPAEGVIYDFRTVLVGDSPEALTLAPDGSVVYVAVTGSNSLAFFSTQSLPLVGRVPVGQAPMGVAFARIAFTPIASTTPTATPTRPPDCVGDCDGSGDVSISELISGVNVALGTLGLDACRNLDADDGGGVTVDELVFATKNALSGCP